MFESIAAFKGAWENSSAATRRVLESLTDASLAQPVAAGYRTLGRIAWHLTTSVGDAGRRMGLEVAGPLPDAPVPTLARDIAAGYAVASASLAHAVEAQWTDETLLVKDDMFGEEWTRGFSLWVMIIHEVHHRGQLTVLMRQAGLPVPGVVGPALEDWARWQMTPPAV
jgi:uncharacterized damage-inducible protein DinB